MLNNSGKVQLIDFGLCNLYNPKSYLNTFCGSLYFAAPELLSAKKYVGPEIDVWSLGVILYVLVCGCVPFDDANLPTLHAKIINGSVDYPSHLSPNLRSLLGRMLVVNPTQRATLDEISQCQWLSRSEKIGNFLPARQPIAKPIDLQVVQNMGGFNFGTKEQIIEKIENSINSGSTESQSIISVYHLVQEKLHRGAAKYKESSQIRVPSEPIKRPLPISVSLINQDSSRIPLRRTRSLENTKNIIRKKRQSFVGFRLTRTRSKQSTVEDYNSVLEKDDSLFSTWKSKVSKFTKKKDLEADAGAKREVAQDDDLAMDFKPKYNPILPQVISVKNKVASAFTSLVSEFKHRTSRSKADVGAEEKINDIVPPIGVEERFPSTMPIDVPSHGRPREGDGSVTPNSDNRLSTSLPQDDIVQPLRSRYLMPLFSRNKAHESDSEAGKQAQKFAHEELSIGQIDDFIEKVAFTRLFTVSTTSTKPVSEIRTAILFALSRLQNPNSMIVNETRGKVVVTLLDSNKRKLSVDAISKLSVSTSNLTDTGEELHTPGDPTVDAPFRSFRVVFEITICRIAIMNLRCVRFKRLSGDTWIYKAACSKILENMGL